MRKFDYLYLILILVIIFNLFYPAELHQTTVPLLIYVVFLIFLSYKIELVYLHKKLEMLKQILFNFTVLGTFLIITSLNSVYLSQSLDHVFIIFSFILIFSFIRLITLNEWKMWNGLYLLLLASIIICIYSILQYTTDFFSLSERLKDVSFISQHDRAIMVMRLAQKRVNAFFAFPTTLSSFLTIIIPINIGAIIKNKSTLIRIFFSLVLSLHLVVLFLTKSYGGIVTLLFVAAFLSAYFLFRRSRLKFKQLSFLILAAFILISLIVTIGYLRGGLFHFKDPANPILLRLANWNVALKIIGDFPLFGVGLGNYGTVFPIYYTPSMQPSQFAHNTYLQVFSEVGVVGGLFLLMFLFKWFMQVLSKGTKKELILPSNYILYFTLLSSFTAFLINNTFEINAYYPSIGFMGIYIGALLDKSAFQCKKTDQGAVYLHSTASREGKITFREKSAVSILIVSWFCVTFLLSARFVGLLLYNTAGEKYLQYDLDAAMGNISVAKLFDPIDSRYRYLSSLILFEKYKTFREKEFINDALESARTAVSLNPKMPYLRANLSSMLFYSGRLWQSLYQLKYADSLMPLVKKYRKEVDLFSEKLFQTNRGMSPPKKIEKNMQ